MRATSALQFGIAESGVKHRDRSAAFGVGERHGRVALICVRREGESPYYDLPGGAIDPGESEGRALAREFGEETGLVVTPGVLLAQADQYATTAEGEAVNNRSALIEVAIDGFDRKLKIEDSHELQWLDPLEALASVRHESHAWAIACWLRRLKALASKA